jgi:hypothetical protein
MAAAYSYERSAILISSLCLTVLATPIARAAMPLQKIYDFVMER